MNRLVFLKKLPLTGSAFLVLALGVMILRADIAGSATVMAQADINKSQTAPTGPAVENNSSDPSDAQKLRPKDKSKADESKTLDWTQALGLLKAREITIDSPRLTINLPDKGGVARVTVTSGQALTPLVAMMKKFAFKKVHLKDGTFVFRTPSGFTQTIYGVNATISGDQNSSVRTAKGRFKFRGEELSFELSSLKPSSSKVGDAVPINFILQGENLKAHMAGSVKFKDGFEVDGKLQLSLPDLKFASAWIGYPLSQGDGTARLNADGAFSWRGSVLSFVDAEFTMGGSKAKGAMSVDLAGTRPRIDGTIALENVDFSDKIIKSTARTGRNGGFSKAGPNPENSAGHVNNENFDLSYLNDFDADFRLSAENVRLNGFDAEDCAATLTLKSGNLFFGLVESKVFGGLVRGEIELKDIGEHRKTYLRADLENIQIEKLVERLELPSLIKGPAHIKLDFTGVGSHLEDVKKSLSGEIKITMDGMVEMASTSGTLTGLPEHAEALEWWTKLQAGVALKSLENIWIFSKGPKGSGSILIKGDGFHISGLSEIDILEKKISLKLDRKPVLNVSPSLDEPEASGNQPELDLPVQSNADFQDKSTNHILIHGPWGGLKIAPNIPLQSPGKNDAPTTPKKPGASDTGQNIKIEPVTGRG